MKLEYRTVALSDIKAEDATPGTFVGRASVYGVVDYGGDAVLPGAFSRTLKEDGPTFPLLSQHDSGDSIGLVTLEDSPAALLVTNGLFELEIQKAREDYARLKRGIVTGLSIGYETRDAEYVKGVRQLKDVKLFEVSLVTFPMNPYATVTTVKAADGSEILDPFALLDRLIHEIKRFDSLDLEVKKGRMISKANETSIRAAHEAAKSAHTKLQGLIDTLDADDQEKALAELESVFGSFTL